MTINNLLSGAFDTEHLHANMAAVAAKTGADMEEFTRQRAASIPAGRFGTPEEFGHACALLCSAHSGYITGPNLLPDGGAFPARRRGRQRVAKKRWRDLIGSAVFVCGKGRNVRFLEDHYCFPPNGGTCRTATATAACDPEWPFQRTPNNVRSGSAEIKTSLTRIQRPQPCRRAQ